ncbi:MAG: methyltransferase domain-containing protein, partial [Phycisphaerae bacterium]
MENNMAAQTRFGPNRHRAGRDRRLTVVISAIACLHALAAGSPGSTTEQVRQASGVKGGLVVHLGCGDGELTAGFHANSSYLVHGLDTDTRNVEKARGHIQSLGLYGKVFAEGFAGRQLPYVDNLVNLVVVSRTCGVSGDEIARVLAPKGVAMISAKVDAFPKPSTLEASACPVDGWTRWVKPWPATIDEWTHFLRDASGNAVARDTQVGPPRRIQWMAGPKRTRDHDALASMSAMTSSAGRVFYILDEGHTSLMHRPPKWKLIA